MNTTECNSAMVHYGFGRQGSFRFRMTVPSRGEGTLALEAEALLSLFGAEMRGISDQSPAEEPAEGSMSVEIEGGRGFAYSRIPPPRSFAGRSTELIDLLETQASRTMHVLLDPMTVQESDILAEQYGIEAARLDWSHENDPRPAPEAPILFTLPARSALGTRLATSSHQKIGGLWDRHSPFVLVSDGTASELARRLSRLMRPSVEALEGHPYYRFWETGALLPALVESGAATMLHHDERLLIGVGEATQRTLLTVNTGSFPAATGEQGQPFQLGILSRLSFQATLRQRQRREVSALLAELDGLQGIPQDRLDQAVESYLREATREGFGKKHAVPMFCVLSACYGAAFTKDAQYPSLSALKRATIRANEAYRLKLLRDWHDHITRQIGPMTPARAAIRLKALADLIGQRAIDPASHTGHDLYPLLSRIDEAKSRLHDERTWERIFSIWRDEYRIYPACDREGMIDYACLLAFCCGQYFLHDRLRPELSALDPAGLKAYSGQ